MKISGRAGGSSLSSLSGLAVPNIVFNDQLYVDNKIFMLLNNGLA